MIGRFLKNSMRGLSMVVGLYILSTGYALASPGDVSFNPQDSVVAPSQAFTVNIVVDTGTQKLAAYTFSITFDPSVVTIDTTKGTDGVEAGTDGFLTAANTDNVAGTLNVSGFTTSGTGPSSALDLLVIHFDAANNPAGGSSTLTLSITDLSDAGGVDVGTPQGINGSVTITGTIPQIVNLSVTPRMDGTGHIDITFTGVDVNNYPTTWVTADTEYAISPYTTWTPITFDTTDPAYTAFEPMAFTSAGAPFVAVVDASAWASGTYRVRLKVNDGTNDSAQTTSSSFTIDNTPPQINSGATAQNLTTVRVVYNEAVRHTSASNADDALNPGNYSISPALTVVSVSYVGNNTTFDLTTGSQTKLQTYTITVSNVEDLYGNAIDPNNDEAGFNGYGSLPQISAPSVSQRTDGTGYLEIAFTGVEVPNANCTWVTSEYAVSPYTTWTPITFDTADPAYTANEPMAFTSAGAPFVAVVDASTWASGTYKVSLKVNDGTNDSALATSNAFTVDNTAPEISSVSPVDSATGVSVSTNITVNFSEVMSQAVTEGAFSISPNIAGAFTWDDTTLTFNPTANLTAKTTYTVTISTAAVDSVGNALGSEYNWSFITGAAPSSSSSSSSSSGGGGGCFIATAAFGTPMAKEVKILSRFRDEYLLTNALGRRFVAFYYKHSPGWAEYISDKEGLKAIVRVGLRPLIWLSELLPRDRTS